MRKIRQQEEVRHRKEQEHSERSEPKMKIKLDGQSFSNNTRSMALIWQVRVYLKSLIYFRN